MKKMLFMVIVLNIQLYAFACPDAGLLAGYSAKTIGKHESDEVNIAGKKLNDKKMGEVGIRKDGNTSKIFHANEKRLKNLDLLAKKEVIVDGRDAHTPYTQAQSLDGRLVDSNISSTTTNNSTSNTDKSQALESKPKLRRHK